MPAQHPRTSRDRRTAMPRTHAECGAETGPTFGDIDDCRMELRFDLDGLIDGVRVPCCLGPSGKVRRQAIQVEERRDVGVSAFPKRVSEKPQHSLTLERPASRVPGSGDESWREEHISVPQGRSQNLVDEDFFGLAFADDDDLVHRPGLPPNMFIFQSSPSAYSSNHSLKSSRSSLVKVDAPSPRSTTTTSSGSSSLTRSAD